MKHGHLLPALLTAVLLAAATAGAAPAPAAKPAGKKVRAAFYADTGSRGAGMLQLARVLAHAPGIELLPVTSRDLRRGELKKFDLLVVPGGKVVIQYPGIGKEGAEAIKAFVRGGGSYLGICAGCFDALPSENRLGLLPFENIPRAWGRDSRATVEISKEGAAVLGIAPGRRRVSYNGGPIVRRVKGPWPHGDGQALAFYKSTVSGPDRPAHKDFFDAPAIICGTYGKGKVIGISFHPEKLPDTEEIVTGAVYAVTGLKTAASHPRKHFHPLRAGYHFAPAIRKDCAGAVREFLELDAHPDLAMVAGCFADRSFDGLDLLLFPEGPAGAYDGFKKEDSRKIFLAFLARGGRIIACEEAAAALPKHPGVIAVPRGGSLLKTAAARK